MKPLHFTFLNIFIYSFSTFAFGVPSPRRIGEWEKWKELCQKAIAEIIEKYGKAKHFKQVNEERLQIMRIKLGKLEMLVNKFPISDLRAKCKRRLGEPTRRAIRFCTHDIEEMAKMGLIIGGFEKQFGTFVVEVETHYLLEMICSGERRETVGQLDKIIEFMEKNETFCEAKYFKMAKKEVKGVKKDEKVMGKLIVQNRIMDAKLSILERELPTKRKMFENADIGDTELVAFVHEFNYELRQVERTNNSYWTNDKDQIKDYLKKVDHLLRLANELIKPLKEIVGKCLEELIRKPQEIINPLINLIENKENFEDFFQILEAKIPKIEEFGEKVMEIVQIIDTQKLEEIHKTVEEMGEAIEELRRNGRRSGEVFAKMRKLRTLLRNEKKQFVERPYQAEEIVRK